MLHVSSLAPYATIDRRSWAVDSMNDLVCLKAKNERLQHEVAKLREENRIRDARMARIDPHRRSHYPPTERMATEHARWVGSFSGGLAS